MGRMIKKSTLMGIGSLIFFSITSCNQSIQPKSNLSYGTIHLSSIDPQAMIIQKLGGPIGYDIEIENYLNRVLTRLSTLSKFRETEISIQILNNNDQICLYFEGGKLLLSRGLLAALSNEAELVASVTLAMMTKAILNQEKIKEIAQLPDEILSGHFCQFKEIFKDAKFQFELSAYEEIITSLGYSKSCLSHILLNRDELLIGLEQQKELEKLVPFLSETATSGYSGEATYQKVIQPLKSLQESYSLERKSLEHFEKDEIKEAILLIKEAIVENPAEGHFYFTLSKFLLKQNSLETAFKAIDQAIKLNNFNASFYLHRAKLYDLISQRTEALEDLKCANDLLVR